MCGTSQDGLDIADVSFSYTEAEGWSFILHGYETVRIPDNLSDRLSSARDISALELARLDVDFGKFCGEAVFNFIDKSGSTAQFVASHGVTIFHNPNEGLTLQIGRGSEIAVRSGLPTICDFRSTDVSRGGQGAPLVPSCDVHLFADYDLTLNLGGFANLSVLKPELKGFDIGPCNLLLNHFARKGNLAFDEGGEIARSGHIHDEMLSSLRQVYRSTPLPPSLGAEWFELRIRPICDQYDALDLSDQLRTSTEFVAEIIAETLSTEGKTLVTGGGALNHFLIERIQDLSVSDIEVPSEDIVEMKEAICFAFLGLLRLNNQENIQASSTGAIKNSVAGAIYHP